MSTDARRLAYEASQGDDDAQRQLWRYADRANYPPQLTPCYVGEGGQIDLEAELRRRLKVYEAAANDADYASLLYRHCQADPHFFFDNFAWTYNQWALPGEPNNRPLVPFDFQRPLIDALLGLGKGSRTPQGHLYQIALDKSRDLGASWITLAAIAWDWIFNKGANYLVISRKLPEVSGRGFKPLFGKLAHFLKQLPNWMMEEDVDYRHLYGSQPLFQNLHTGCTIEGEATVPDSSRGGRFRRFIIDEAAVIPFLSEILDAASNSTKGVVLIGTPNGMNNTFADVIHGKEGHVIQPWGTPGPGWRHFRWHYSQHPDRIPGTPEGDAWYAEERARMPEERWAREMEISYTKSVKGRIWHKFNRNEHVYTPEAWAPWAPYVHRHKIIEGWDFGARAPTAVVWAVYYERNDILICYRYNQWIQTLPRDVAQDIGAMGFRCNYRPQGLLPTRRVGDPTGHNKGHDLRSYADDYRDEGIIIAQEKLGRQWRIERLWNLINKKIEDGKLFFAPACMERLTRDGGIHPTLVEAVEQYRRRDPGTQDIDTPANKDKYSHLADALQYVCHHVWGDMIPRTQRQADAFPERRQGIDHGF